MMQWLIIFHIFAWELHDLNAMLLCKLIRDLIWEAHISDWLLTHSSECFSMLHYDITRWMLEGRDKAWSYHNWIPASIASDHSRCLQIHLDCIINWCSISSCIDDCLFYDLSFNCAAPDRQDIWRHWIIFKLTERRVKLNIWSKSNSHLLEWACLLVAEVDACAFNASDS